jgi:uncharacterized integral membrane protein
MSAATIMLFVIAFVLTMQLLAWIVSGVRINTYNNKIRKLNQAHKEK